MQIVYKLYGGNRSGALIELNENIYRTDDGYVRIRDYLYMRGVKYMLEYFVYEADLNNSRRLAENEFRNYLSSVFSKDYIF
ncbi:hypothetical protein EA742_01455 [Acinetobacter baumannii]|nr:hypothetical protein EA742_01455 [Acinetobacter baumannii]